MVERFFFQKDEDKQRWFVYDTSNGRTQRPSESALAKCYSAGIASFLVAKLNEQDQKERENWVAYNHAEAETK